MKRMHNPPHPGTVLQEYLGDMPIRAAAMQLGLEHQILQKLLEGSSAISQEIAARLASVLGTSTQLWLGLQQQYEEEQATMATQQDLHQPEK